MKKAQDKKQRLTLSLDAPDAKEAKLLGDFNNWNGKSHQMTRDEKGFWKKIVVLSAGRYEYKFLVDGDWWHDPDNTEVCYNQHGTLNSMLIVS